MGIVSKIILLPLIIIGGLLILTGVGAVYFIGWDNVVDFFTTEEIPHNCDITNNTCLDNAIAGKWVAHGCGEIILGYNRLLINSTPGKAVCVGTNVVIRKGEPSTKEAIKIAKEKIRFYCCDAKSCIEEKTYYMAQLIDYADSEKTPELLTKFKEEVNCIDTIRFELPSIPAGSY